MATLLEGVNQAVQKGVSFEEIGVFLAGQEGLTDQYNQAISQGVSAQEVVNFIATRVPEEEEEVEIQQPEPTFPDPSITGGGDPTQFAEQPQVTESPEIPPDPIDAPLDVTKITAGLGAGVADFLLSSISGFQALTNTVSAKIAGLSFEEALEEGDKVLEEFPKLSEGLAKIAPIKTEAGIKTQEQIGQAFEFVFKGLGEKLAEQVPEGFPNTKAFVSTATEAVMLALLPTAEKVVSKGVKVLAKPSLNFIKDVSRKTVELGRDLTIPEQVKSLEILERDFTKSSFKAGEEFPGGIKPEKPQKITAKAPEQPLSEIKPPEKVQVKGKAKKEVRRKGFDPEIDNLETFVRKTKGVKAKGDAIESEIMSDLGFKERKVRGLVNEKAGQTLSKKREAALEAGFPVKNLTDAEFLEKIKDPNFFSNKKKFVEAELPKPGERGGPKERVGEPELNVGDKFTIEGEEFKVKSKKGPDLTIEDGRTFKIQDFESVEVDVGSLQKGVKFGKVSEKPVSAFKQEKGQAPFELPQGEIEAGGLAFEADLPKFAGNINLERIDAPKAAKRLILDVSDRFKGRFDKAKRGKIAFDQTKAMADELGLSVDSLLKRRKGQALNAEEATASRNILNASAQKTRRLQELAAKTGSDKDLAQFRLAFEQHVLIQEQVSGATAEAGRSLSSFRIKSVQQDLINKNFERMIEKFGGRDLTKDVMQKLASFDKEDVAGVNKYIRDAAKIRTSDKLFEVWVNALLSGPQTHAVNTISNTMTFLSKLPERTVAATIDFAKTGLTGKPRSIFFGETPQSVIGTWEGAKQGVLKGLKAFNEETFEGIGKLDTPIARQRAISGKKGRVIRIPGRALEGMDAFYKAVNFQSEMHSLAYRQAVIEGLKGKSRQSRMAELINNPSKKMLEQATEEMYYRVFQKKLGPSGRKLTSLRNETIGLKYIIPFLRTPINIAKFGLERTPLNFPNVFRKIMKGEITGETFSAEMAKPVMGSIIAAVTMQLVKEGLITGGGPKDSNKKAALRRTGWQPYSIKVGNNFFSYGRLEPLAVTMGLSADAIEIWDEMSEDDRESIAALVASSITQNLTNKTFMRGLSDAIKAINDPVRYGDNWVQRFAGTSVPSVVAGIARANDPTLRNPDTILQSVMARIPGLTDDIPERLNLWGEEIPLGKGTFAERFLSPIYRSEGKFDKIDREIVRMKLAIGKPSRFVTTRGKRTKLTPKQYVEFVKISGREAKRKLDSILLSPRYDLFDDNGKEDLIKKIIRKARRKTLFQLKLK